MGFSGSLPAMIFARLFVFMRIHVAFMFTSYLSLMATAIGMGSGGGMVVTKAPTDFTLIHALGYRPLAGRVQRGIPTEEGLRPTGAAPFT